MLRATASRVISHCYRHAKQLLKYKSESGQALPANSFSLPPDTPARFPATSFSDWRQDSYSSTEASSVLPPEIHQSAAALDLSRPLRQPSNNPRLSEDQHIVHSAGLHSASVPRLTRLLSPGRRSFDHRPNINAVLSQPDSGSRKQRVMANSATILSFAELRRSMDDAAARSVAHDT